MDEHNLPQSPEPSRHWLDQPRNVNRIVRGLYLLCGLVLALDLLDGWLDFKQQIHPELARAFGFYGIFGFVCCVGLVLCAKGLRKLLMRKEDYYDE
jgi:hypothetical protein